MGLLQVQDLEVTYHPPRQAPVTGVRGVSLGLEADEFVGVVGESGSGKSTLIYALARLLPPRAEISRGRVLWKGVDWLALPPEELRRRRWQELSLVLQSSMNSLNPVLPVYEQFRDAILAHTHLSEAEIERRVEELFQLIKVDPRFRRAYPHELSGGMKQRVAIAMALVLKPELVLMDEPTTGLDVVVQRELLRDLRELQQQQGFSVLFVSHDLGTVLEVADRVLVMYAGRIVEDGTVKELLEHPLHPYTRALLDCYADPASERLRITYIPGQPPSPSSLPPGCPFAPRCPLVEEVCQQEPELSPVAAGRVACWVTQREHRLPLQESGAAYVEAHPLEGQGEPLLHLEEVSKTYRRGARKVQALDRVSLTLKEGWVTALVGESGSGKSTLARLITAVEVPDSGSIRFSSLEVPKLRGKALRAYRGQVQLVFQDPFAALNPVHTVLYTLLRPLINHRHLRGRQALEEVEALLEQVGLTPPQLFAHKRTHELSGGQAQRVVIARALAAGPRLLVADEPVSMLDVSIRAGILKLLDDLRRSRRFSLLYITHDLLSARLLTDEIVVLHHGRIVEQGPAQELARRPKDPYTQKLLDSIPNPRRSRVSGG